MIKSPFQEGYFKDKGTIYFENHSTQVVGVIGTIETEYSFGNKELVLSEQGRVRANDSQQKLFPSLQLQYLFSLQRSFQKLQCTSC